jgi:hypothetical protein
MVSIVFVHPPAVADAHERVGQRSSATVVRLPGLEDLAVGGLMPQEGELGKDHAQSTGQQQLQPGVLEQDHAGGNATEGEH